MKRTLYRMLACLVGLLLAELIAFAAAGLIAPDSDLAAMRRALSPAPDEELHERVRAGRGGRQSVALHPYLGSVRAGAAKEGGHGFESTRLLLATPTEDFVVLLTGGSVAVNFALDMRKSFAPKLAALPQLGGRRVHFISAALGGWHQPQQLMTLAWYRALGARIDLVINLDGFNEAAYPIGQAISGLSPLYPRDWPGLTADFKDPATREALGRLAATDRLRSTWARLTSKGILAHSSILALAWKFVDDRLAAETLADIAFLEEDTGEADFRKGLVAKRWTTEDRAEAAADLWINTSQAMYDMQAAAGGYYLHVLQPNQYLKGSKTLSPGERVKAWAPNSPAALAVAEVYPRFLARKQELRDSESSFLDASGIFEKTNASLYIDKCCHFSRPGNVILADAILKHLQTSNLLSSRRTTTPRHP